MFMASFAQAATKTASVTGNWNATATWGGSPIPTSSDDVIINSGVTVSFNIYGTSTTVLSLTVNESGVLTFNTLDGNSLTITGDVTNNGTLRIGNQTGGAKVHTLNVGGNFTNNGIFYATDPIGGTGQDDHLDVVLNGTAAQLIGGTTATIFRDLTISNTSAAVTATNNFSVTHITFPADYDGYTLTVNANATFNTGTYVISGTGDFTLAPGGTLGIGSTAGITSSGATGSIQVTGTRTYSTDANYTYIGAASQNIGNGFPTNLSGTMTVDNTGNIVTLDNTRTIASGGSIVLTAGTFAAGTNLTMSSFSSLIQTGGNITGNLQGTGTYSVTYTGNSITTGAELSGSGLNNLTVNLNSSQSLTLDQSRTVAGTLTLTNGNIITNSNILTLGTSTSSLGTLSRTSGTITGNFQRWFTASTMSNVLFPIGTASNYRPANISFTSAPSIGGTLTSFFTASNPGTAGLPLDDGGTSIVNVGIEGYWTINAANGLAGGTYSLDLTADGFIGVIDVSTLRIIKRSTSGSWTLNGSHTAGTGTTGTPVVHRTGMSGFSEFGIGSPSDNPLPVELSFFSAVVSESGVNLKWITETEVNNYGFEVQRSESEVEGFEFKPLGFVEGYGTTNTPQSYSYSDRYLSTGKYNYRLKQIDFNGNYHYYYLGYEVNIGIPNKFKLSQNYPNPFNPVTKIDYNIPYNFNITLKLYDITGREIATLVNETQTAGYYTLQFDASNFASGTYLYTITADDGANNYVMTKRMILVK